MADINPFNDVSDKPLDTVSNYGTDILRNVAAIEIGRGARAFKADESGIWLGGKTFATAPFSVDMLGNLIANSATLGGYSKVNVFKQDAIPTSVSIGDLWIDSDDNNKLYWAASVGANEIKAGEWVLSNDLRAADALLKAGLSQNFSGSFTLGTSNITIDGANKRIIINDGANDRILIGYQSGGF